MKKIYFSCSITGGRDHAHVYQDIVDMIKAENMQVLGELFADKSITPTAGSSKQKGLAPAQIWADDIAWVKEADAVIAEVSQPSLGVGYEVGTAFALGTPVLALYYTQPDRRLSSMISGSPNVVTFEYTDVTQVAQVIHAFLTSI